MVPSIIIYENINIIYIICDMFIKIYIYMFEKDTYYKLVQECSFPFFAILIQIINGIYFYFFY